MKRKLIFITWLLLIWSGMYAQIQIQGVVRDQEGESLPGANIVIKGTTRGAISDLEGRFTLNDVSSETVFVGFFPQRQLQ